MKLAFMVYNLTADERGSKTAHFLDVVLFGVYSVHVQAYRLK
jgi:hypothetical protein